MSEIQTSSSTAQYAPVTERKFVAANMNVAMRQLSEALGEEAILVSSRRVAEGVEVVGRLPNDPEASSIPASGADRRQGERRTNGRRATDAIARDDVVSDGIEASGLRAAQTKDTEFSQRERELFDLAATTAPGAARDVKGDVADLDDLKEERSSNSPSSAAERTRSSKQRMVINLQQSAADIAQQIDRLNRRNSTENSTEQPSPSAAQADQSSTLMSTDSLRKLLGETLHTKAEDAVLSPGEFTVCHRLRTQHIDENLVRTLLARSYRQLDGEPATVPALWRRIKSEFLALLPVTVTGIEAGGVYAVTGGDGSGKTSVLLKLVADFALRGQASDIAVVSFAGEDNSVSGQRLHRLSKVSGIPVLTVTSEQSFDDVLKRCSSRRTVLVDTSVNRLDSRSVCYKEALAKLTDIKPVVELLCLDATSARGYVDRMIEAYRTDSTAGVIATRTELAEDVGSLVSALIVSELPLVYVSSGEVHPDSLQKSDNEAVWQSLFEETEEAGAIEYSAFTESSLPTENEEHTIASVNLTSDRSPSVADHNLQ